MKRGGEEIYVGPVGQNSSRLIEYFEVRREVKDGYYNCLLQKNKNENPVILSVQGIEGISNIKDGYNPATWMLEVTSSSQEEILGVDFSEIYRRSELYQ